MDSGNMILFLCYVDGASFFNLYTFSLFFSRCFCAHGVDRVVSSLLTVSIIQFIGSFVFPL